jgi:dTDP-4-dehydrorhamnose 3,5-epimerase
MDILPTEIVGVFELRGPVFTDQRGTFVKTFHEARFRERGLNTTWRELFWSSSVKGVVRGLHFQAPPSDHVKLVACVAGAIWDVAVDLRRASPTYGKHVARELSAGNGAQLYIPRGMAHGFLALSDVAVVSYALETVHDPVNDCGVLWNSCGIPWPLDGMPIISARDAALPELSGCESPF